MTKHVYHYYACANLTTGGSVTHDGIATFERKITAPDYFEIKKQITEDFVDRLGKRLHLLERHSICIKTLTFLHEIEDD